MPYEAFKEFCETNHVVEVSCATELQEAFEKMAAGEMPVLTNHPEPTEDTDVKGNVIQMGEYK